MIPTANTDPRDLAMRQYMDAATPTMEQVNPQWAEWYDRVWNASGRERTPEGRKNIRLGGSFGVPARTPQAGVTMPSITGLQSLATPPTQDDMQSTHDITQGKGWLALNPRTPKKAV